MSIHPFPQTSDTSIPCNGGVSPASKHLLGSDSELEPTAVIYCEGNFASMIGEIANRLIGHSGRYEIMSVIDSEKAGFDASEVLGLEPNGIPICHEIDDPLVCALGFPTTLS